MSLMDLTGQRFADYTVIRRDPYAIANCSIYWVCQCKCGQEVSIRSDVLRKGLSSRCPICVAKERIEKRKTKNKSGKD